MIRPASHLLLIAAAVIGCAPSELRTGEGIDANAPATRAARLDLIRARQHSAPVRFAFDQDFTAPTALATRAHIDEDGLSLFDRQLEIVWVGLGRDQQLELVPPGIVDTHDNMATIEHSTSLRQWWLNGPLGLEQGFTIARPPPGHGDEVIIALSVSGARVSANHGSVSIEHANHRLRYTDLFAEDAAHIRLATRMLVTDDGHILLAITDRDATYPLHIDPLVQTFKVVPADGSSGGHFGRAVGMNGAHAVVGAYLHDGVGQNSGAGYILERDAMGAWEEAQKLSPSHKATNDFFGISAAMGADFALVGANDIETWVGYSKGTAYVFERDDGGEWEEAHKLHAEDATNGDLFGNALALRGNFAILGAPGDDNGGPKSGSAYIFERNANGDWSQKQKLTAPDSAGGDQFGSVVAIHGDWALVGAQYHNGSTGAAYLFERNNVGAWTLAPSLTPSDAAPGDRVGAALALGPKIAFVGAPGDDDGGSGSGSVTVFIQNDQGAWVEQQKLVDADAKALAHFGASVAVDNNLVIIGAPGDHDAPIDSGRVIAFELKGGTWTQAETLSPDDGATGDQFGVAVATDGGSVLIGADLDDDKGLGTGAVYVFDVNDGELGNPCGNAGQCLSGFCVDGVCCDSACGDSDPGDCQACSVEAGSSTDGTCETLGDEATCREATNECDLVDSCNGINVSCAEDRAKPNGTPCDSGNGACIKGVCTPKTPVVRGGQGGPKITGRACVCATPFRDESTPWALWLVPLALLSRRRSAPSNSTHQRDGTRL